MTENTPQKSFTVFEKATLKPITQIEAASPELVRSTVSRARRVRLEWASRPTLERVAKLPLLRELLTTHANEIAVLLTRENGKPLHESLLNEVVALIDAIDWLIESAPSILASETLSSRWLKHRIHHIERRPLGVTAILSPFNFPLLISGVDALSAIVTGCPAIIKPSEHCPLSVEYFVKLAHRAGIPEEVLQVLHGGPDIGQELVTSNIDAVRFTGNRENGRNIAIACAQLGHACTLELGGNCPLLVLEDAEIERLAPAILFGALSNSGQTCIGVSRVLVPRVLEPALTAALVPLIGKLRQGNPMSGPVELGALTTILQVERCHEHVLSAIKTGSKLAVGGSTGESGHFYLPTLLSGCKFTDKVACEETFGPVIALIPYDNESLAVDALNADAARLVAYVFGRESNHLTQIAKQLDYGQVITNQVLYTYICPEIPLGGFKGGGQGTTHGREGLLSYSTPKLLGSSRLRLPSMLEFASLDPARADALAHTFLSSTSAIKKVSRWFIT